MLHQYYNIIVTNFAKQSRQCWNYVERFTIALNKIRDVENWIQNIEADMRAFQMFTRIVMNSFITQISFLCRQRLGPKSIAASNRDGTHVPSSLEGKQPAIPTMRRKPMSIVACI